jgi:Kef-type K+ transport system membrane component KefB
MAMIGPVENPVLVFLIFMTIMLVAPLLFERVRLPGIIGLILAGLVVGP